VSPISLSPSTPTRTATQLTIGQTGQVLQALVVALLKNGAYRLALPNLLVDVQSPVPLRPGAEVPIQLARGPAGAQLVLIDGQPRPPGSPQAGLPMPQAHPLLVLRADPLPRVASPSLAPEGGPAAAGKALPADAETEPTVARTTSAAAPVLAPPPRPTMLPPTLAAALFAALRTAAPKQDGLAPLLANLEHVVASNPKNLPPFVRQAAEQVLALRMPLDEMTDGVEVKQAFQRSGLFLEANLAALVRTPSTAAIPPDLKAALLVLRNALSHWLGTDAAAMPGKAQPNGGSHQTQAPSLPSMPTQAAPDGRPSVPPPPYRDGPTTAQPAMPPNLPEGLGGRETAERLLTQTDAALARQTLTQIASLPDADPSGARQEATAPRWNFEVPLVTPQGTHVAQFEISRDGHGTGAEGEQPALWRARFTLEVEPLGPVHAQIVIGARTSVTLWAEREASAAWLREERDLLTEALQNAELEPGTLRVNFGKPPSRPAPAGYFMDQLT